MLAPGEEVAMNETVEVDICEDSTFTTPTKVILDETSNYTPYIDTEQHECKTYKICEVDV